MDTDMIYMAAMHLLINEGTVESRASGLVEGYTPKDYPNPSKYVFMESGCGMALYSLTDIKEWRQPRKQDIICVRGFLDPGLTSVPLARDFIVEINLIRKKTLMDILTEPFINPLYTTEFARSHTVYHNFMGSTLGYEPGDWESALESAAGKYILDLQASDSTRLLPDKVSH